MNGSWYFISAWNNYAGQYMSKGKRNMSNINPRICACVKQVLVESWFLDTRSSSSRSHSGIIFVQSVVRRHPVSWILIGWKSFHCAMYLLLLLDLVSKNQLSTNQNLFNASTNSRIYVGHVSWLWTCIALISVWNNSLNVVLSVSKWNENYLTA